MRQTSEQRCGIAAIRGRGLPDPGVARCGDILFAQEGGVISALKIHLLPVHRAFSALVCFRNHLPYCFTTTDLYIHVTYLVLEST